MRYRFAAPVIEAAFGLAWVAIVAWVALPDWAYRWGIENRGFDVGLLMGFGTLLFAAIGAMAIFLSLALTWRQRGWRARLGGLLLLVAVVSTPVTAIVVGAVIHDLGAVRYAEGFAVWAKGRITGADLRVWDAALRPAPGTPVNWPVHIERHRLPASIGVWSPSGASVESDGSFVVYWGDGFGHWGLVLEAPGGGSASGLVYRSYRVAVEPGVFAWHELQ